MISPEDLTSPEGVAKVTRSIGEAIGMSGAAEEKISAFNKEIETLDARAASGSSHPSALALMSRGPQVMAMDGGLMLPGLISRAGGEYAAERIGLKSTRPIDAEQLVKANPDVLFLEDFQGQGRAPFEELLNNPAVAEVPAIKNNRIHVMSQTEASSVSGLNTAVGFEKIISAIHEDTN